MKYTPKISLLFLALTISGFANAQNSVLAKGKWIRIGVTETGIYGIDENFLKKLQVNTSGINPAHIRVFGNNEGSLPQANTAPRIPDLTELSVLCTDLDGKFDKNDKIYFLGQSPHKVFSDETGSHFLHEINPYSDTTFYFVTYTEGASKKITAAPAKASAFPVIDTFNHFEFYEIDQKNLLNSGRVWLGEFINNQASFPVKIEGLVKSKPLLIHSSLAGVGRSAQQMDLNIDDKTVATHELMRTLYINNDIYARYNRVANWSELDFYVSPLNESFNVTYKLKNATSSSAGAYLDYFTINGQRQLKEYPGQTVARILNPGTTPSYNFKMSGIGPNTLIWEVDDKFNPKSVSNQAISGVLTHSGDFVSRVKTFLITDPQYVYTPTFSALVSNQDIRSSDTPDMVIVFPESFRNEVQILAEHRKTKDKLDVLMLSTEEIYNEFSSGSPDPTAIRDLCRFFYQKDKSKFRYLLIFGDGSYDYKNISSFSFVNKKLEVPAYQSRESMEPVYSYSSDDYFGFLEDHEGEWKEGYSENNFWYKSREDDHTLDIGIGRIPAKSKEEAKAVVNKLLYYDSISKSPGNWKNRISFVADDKDYNIHQRDAEGLSSIVSTKSRAFLIQKLYLDAYPMISSPNGSRSPKATEALQKAVEDGSFIINYNGHGSEDGWAEEKLLTTPQITHWRNLKNLPLFFTATCQFGKFDNPSLVSGAELALLNPSGGAIGLLTTTRPVYSSTNFTINTAFYDFLSKSEAKRVGDLFRLTKNSAIDGEINRNFTFLGDPSLLIPDFTSKVEVTKINGVTPKGQLLKALSKVNIEGEVKTQGFNGTLNLVVYDKSSKVSTLGSSSESPKMEYETLRSKLFEGQFEVVNSRFSASFVIPKDIDYRTGQGKMFLYAISKDSASEYFGNFEDFLIGGSEDQAVKDNTGPKIEMKVNNNTLSAVISDESGINISQSGIGHEMLIILNDTMKVVANPYFYNISGYTHGQLSYNFGNLAEGKYQVKLIVWDTHNNKSEETLVFNIQKPTLKIEDLKNYPNPFKDFTTFSFTHNRPDDDLEINMKITDGLGRVIFNQQYNCYVCEPKKEIGIDFNANFITNGQLFYKIDVKSLRENISGFASGKLLFWK
jgi:hypothetical protein